MSEADQVYAEAERRKQRAEELGLPKIVFDFYYELARHFPARWAAFPECLPQSVTDVQEIGQDVVFSLGQDRYTFRWSEQSVSLADGDVGWGGELVLSVNEKRVLQISVHGESDEVAVVSWTPADVAAFVEGPWVQAISALAVEAKCAHEEATRLAMFREKEDPKELAYLKERFRIESDEPSKVEPGSVLWKLFGAEKPSWLKRLLGI